jgi:hypothetical protein
LAALGTFIALWIWALHYQPIRIDGGLGGAGRITGGEWGFDPDKQIDNVLGTEYDVAYPKPGVRLGLGLSLRNAGHHGVRVSRVGFDLGPTVTWVRESTYVSGNPSGSGLPMVAFKPFTLKPGTSRDFIVVLTVDACPSGYAPVTQSAGSGVFGSVRVFSRAFGIHHQSDLALYNEALRIDGWPMCRPVGSR